MDPLAFIALLVSSLCALAILGTLTIDLYRRFRRNR
jgi:hypothetical protein